ncbi:class I SAM-dependent methyltransferase [Methanobacterium formicicum]|uniref:Methyltransferase n=1 Tax=Methanobacterium formicicum (strain DSM 3637 / PP1) TaxID=1204725 RepID=K2R027_METFP|nr:class I SAM-dependent methyltransferase [Methanobacterium formicicum]EKF85873.1 methyltransferase [Methanobacterium formicicum DSM 3637]
MSNLDSYRAKKDHIRENLNKYTIKAYKSLSEIENPRILDVGCGTGVPTVELARISGGNITALDDNENSLNMLKAKIKAWELDKKVTVLNDSIFTMDVPDESFDIIWAEGSVFVMGFENSIKNWRRFLKSDGFLVIHDDSKDKDKKLELVKKHGYRLIDEFELSHQVWSDEYYKPLEQLIKTFKDKQPDDQNLINELNKDQIEIDQSFSSVMASSLIIIIQKT